MDMSFNEAVKLYLDVVRLKPTLKSAAKKCVVQKKMESEMYSQKGTE